MERPLIQAATRFHWCREALLVKGPCYEETNSGSCQRRLLSSSQEGEEEMLSSHSSFFKNNAHLNSGSNGIGSLPELRFLFRQWNPNHWSLN